MEILAEQAPQVKRVPKCLWCKLEGQVRTGQGFTGFCREPGHERMYVQRALDKLMREGSVQSSAMAALEEKDSVIAFRKAKRAFNEARREKYAKGEPVEQVPFLKKKGAFHAK